MLKKVGGLSLISVEDAMKALMSKWIHSSPSHCLIKCASVTEVPHHKIVIFLSWLMGSIFFLVVFP
jgi:hypothetical protein